MPHPNAGKFFLFSYIEYNELLHLVMEMHIDLNCDLGEGCGNDHLIMPFISSANISCGYHAGDEQSMREAMLLAKQYNVAVGIHPSFPDKENFGRKEMMIEAHVLKNMIADQIVLFKKIASELNVVPVHIKPHGALYNMSAKNIEIARIIAQTVCIIDPSLIIYGLANSQSALAAERYGLKFCHEVFADRTYTDEGLLTSRSIPNALIDDEATSLNQIVQMIKAKSVTSTSGKIIPIQADTICIHGDGAHAVRFAQTIHQHLITTGITISAP